MGIGMNFGEDSFAFFLLDLNHFNVAQFFGGFFVRDFDDIHFGVGGQALEVFVDALFQVLFF